MVVVLCEVRENIKKKKKKKGKLDILMKYSIK